MFQTLHPKNILLALDSIDSDSGSYVMDRRSALRRVMWTLATVAISLLLINYLKNSSVLREILYGMALFDGLPKKSYINSIYSTGYGELIAYCWWTFWQFIGYLVLPFIVIKVVFKDQVMDYGWRTADVAKHWRGYLLLLSPILCFVVIASFRDDFSTHYPFYSQAGRSWTDFLLWEMLYIAQFICLEFFFRGFMLRALQPALGANAIWIMCVPYLMIHFPKLWPEATGAFLFGLFLGILAMRSRSIWGGVAVHVGIALLMDITALMQRGAIPKHW